MTLCQCCVTTKFVGLFEFITVVLFTLGPTVSANTARRELECLILVIFGMEANNDNVKKLPSL